MCCTICLCITWCGGWTKDDGARTMEKMVVVVGLGSDGVVLVDLKLVDQLKFALPSVGWWLVGICVR